MSSEPCGSRFTKKIKTSPLPCFGPSGMLSTSLRHCKRQITSSEPCLSTSHQSYAQHEYYEDESRLLGRWLRDVGDDNPDCRPENMDLQVSLEEINCRPIFVYPRIRACPKSEWPDKERLDLLRVPMSLALQVEQMATRGPRRG